jgi:hypothetical protein
MQKNHNPLRVVWRECFPLLSLPMSLCNTNLTDNLSKTSVMYVRYSQLLETSLDSNTYLAETSPCAAMATLNKLFEAESRMGHVQI